MTSVLVVSDKFPQATQFVHLASQRGIDALLSSQKDITKSNALVLSSQIVKKFGGVEKLVGKCR